MKVLHCVPSVGLIYGGPSVSVLDLANSLGSLGLEVDIVTTNLNGSSILDVPLFTWLEEKNYRIQYFPALYFKDYKISFSLAFWLYKNIHSYDVINSHAIFSLSNIPCYLFSFLNQKISVIHPHGMLDGWALNYKSWKKSPYYTLIEKPALKSAQAIRVLTSSEDQNIKSLAIETPTYLIPNGLDPQIFINRINPAIFYEKFPQTRDKHLVLFLGRIDPKKGLDLLAPAFAKVNQEFPNTHLVIAGPDNVGYLPTVKKIFKNLECLDAVTFTGMLTGDMKYAALSVASIYIAPSYSEGFSMSILEGMASGLPCIFTTACNFPEAKEAQVAKVVEVNQEEITEALLWCLSNEEAAKEMGQKARQFILENYTWDKIAVKLVEVYRSIIENHSKQIR
jgi:glycosyltransferase involved in cell wall biosynthesis